MQATFRDKFPPPWRISESRVAVTVIDANGITLATISIALDEHPGPKMVASMKRRDAMALAKRIVQLTED